MLAIDLLTRPEPSRYAPAHRLDATRPSISRAPARTADPPPRGAIDISSDFIADILKPYRPSARYLHEARIDRYSDKRAVQPQGHDTALITASGRFSIPESCYIDDTGHFNAVEFNICYNQLAYVAFGKCSEAGVLTNLRLDEAGIGFAEFKRHQLSSMLIVKIESRYYKPMISDDFRAVLRVERISASGRAFFCFTSIDFSDAEGVKSKGTVLLAYNPVMGA